MKQRAAVLASLAVSAASLHGQPPGGPAMAGPSDEKDIVVTWSEAQVSRQAPVPAGQKHWHGASPATAMSHIAITEQLDGKSVEWMEKVIDEQYKGPVRPRPQR